MRAALKQVNLMPFAHRYSGGYSGGMKRRLSMANALVGNPSVVFIPPIQVVLPTPTMSFQR